MGSPIGPPEPSSVLCELLRRTLSLVEYYGRLETNEASLFELKLALTRTIKRLESEQAAQAVAAKGQELELPMRKAPNGEIIDITRPNKVLDKKL